MRRSELIKVVVFCPHFKRTVTATRNQAIDRLVACESSAECRPPASEAPAHDRCYPQGCPVYPQLAR